MPDHLTQIAEPKAHLRRVLKGQIVRLYRCRSALLSHPLYFKDPSASKIAELGTTLAPSLRLDHKVSCWHGYAPFQSVGNKFKNDLRI